MRQSLSSTRSSLLFAVLEAFGYPSRNLPAWNKDVRMNRTDLLVSSHTRWIVAFSGGDVITMVIHKRVVNLLTGSLAILSKVLRSFLDPGAATTSLFSIRISARLLNQEHPCRHGEMENISALAKSFSQENGCTTP